MAPDPRRDPRRDLLGSLRRAAGVARWVQTLLLVAACAALVWWLVPSPRR